MNKRILLLTDFSKNALNAIQYAFNLYANRECTFYILNTYHPDSYSIESHIYNHSGQRVYDINKPKTEEQFENLMHVLGQSGKNPKHSRHTIVANNSLLEGTNDVIAKYDIEMVIMGAKGMTGSRNIVFGMNTINIMENVRACPVLAIPDDLSFKPPKEIVFPTDYKTPFKRRELKYLINIAQMHDTVIKVLYIKESEKWNKLQTNNKILLTKIFKNVENSFHELEGVTVQQGIDTFINDHGSDIVAFINQKRNFFSRIISTPLIKKLGYHSRVPVLVLRHRI